MSNQRKRKHKAKASQAHGTPPMATDNIRYGRNKCVYVAKAAQATPAIQAAKPQPSRSQGAAKPQPSRSQATAKPQPSPANQLVADK